MKYVWAIVIVILLVRIDSILKFIEKGVGRVNISTEDSASTANTPDKEIVPLTADLGQQNNPRLILFTLLSNFRTNPDKNNHDKIIEHITKYPELFSEKIDTTFEASIYSWRDLLIQRNIEAVDLLLNLMNILKGENQLMIQKFLTILMDEDIKTFLKAYMRTKDVGCNIASEIADNITDEEKYNELTERADRFDAYLSSDQVDQTSKQLGINCQTTLKVQLEKLKALYGTPVPTIPAEEQLNSATPPPAEPSPESQVIPILPVETTP